MKNKKINYITFALVVTCLLIYGSFLMTSMIRNDIKNNLINEYAGQENLIATQLAQVLELELSQRQSELKLIAKLPEIISGDTTTCNQKLNKLFQDKNNKLGNYGRVNKDGYFTCSLNKKLIGVKSETLGTYMTDIFNDPEHKPVMSKIIKPAGSDSYIIAIHVPVWNDFDEFVGTVGGAIYLDDLKKKYLKDIEIIQGGEIAIFDQDGSIINHYIPELIGDNIASEKFQNLISGTSPIEKIIEGIKNGTSGTRRYYFKDIEKIAAYVPIHAFPDRNWRIIVTIPTSNADDNLVMIGTNRILSVQPTIFGLVVLVFFAIFLFSLRKKIIH